MPVRVPSSATLTMSAPPLGVFAMQASSSARKSAAASLIFSPVI